MTYSLAQAAIANYLEQSDISIHLLGQYYGVVPEETDKSILSIQYEMAAEQSEKGTLERLAWIFPTIDQTDER